MNYQDSLKLLTSQEKFRIDLGLERVKKLAEIFGNPQNNIKIIHVAGTNGKGSVCAMLAKICEENGYKTGLYTSPHLKKYTERFKINFQDITEEDFAKYIQIVENSAKENNIGLTEFEILTMMAFLYFSDQKVDILVLETGMGGRLDATNIVEKPILTIITSISSDHMDRLGDTIEKIAAEKAGILKKDVPIIISTKNSGYKTIAAKASEMHSPLLSVEKDFELTNIEKNIFSNGQKSYELSLKGVNQGQNLALADKACEYLNLNPQHALKNIIWPSRMQYIKEKNLLIDAAHNPDAVKLLKQNLGKYYPTQKRIFLFGALNTKDYKKIIENLFSTNDTIFVTDKFAHNAIPKEILLEEITKKFPNAKAGTIDLDNIKEFIEKKTNNEIKICCGSFYLCSKLL